MKIENQEQKRRDLEATCVRLARTIAEALPEGVGFAFILSDFGDKGNAAYFSNVVREGMIKLLRETANRIEGAGN